MASARMLIACALAGAFLSLSCRAEAGGAGVPVFMYHRVSPEPVTNDAIGKSLTITPAQFETQLRFLRSSGVATLTAAELASALARKALPEGVTVLTFDDGYADNARFALPLLLRYGAKATFYVIASTVGTPRHLSWTDIRRLREAGMEIGAHGWRHVDLTELDARGQRDEIERCIRTLRLHAGIVPETYAYPAGRYNAITTALLPASRLRLAFGTQPGRVTLAEDIYALPRIRVRRETAATLFAQYFGAQGFAWPQNDPAIVARNAAARAAGNRREAARALGRTLFRTVWPAQVVKVRVDAVGRHSVAGLVLDGAKFHRALGEGDFLAEVSALVRRSFDASAVEEVDLWTTVPLDAGHGAVVSGDLAKPTSRTVFSVTVRRLEGNGAFEERLRTGKNLFWDPQWRALLRARRTRLPPA